MMLLEECHPDVAAEFKKGHFVVKKTQHAFSGISLDHAHEQNNKLVKCDGGALGLTENSSQLLRWIMSGPEVARLVNEFECSLEATKSDQDEKIDCRHHEQRKGVQKAFKKQVKSLSTTITEMGNHFQESTTDLLVLDTQDIMLPSVVETAKTSESMGQNQYREFVAERLEARSKSLFEPIKLNKLPLFSSHSLTSSQKRNAFVASSKQNVALFSLLYHVYVSCQVRDGNLDTFFSHENQDFPPSLSTYGDIRTGTKSDILQCLEKVSPSQNDRPDVDMLLSDKAVTANMLRPRAVKTFHEYSHQVFLPFLKYQG